MNDNPKTKIIATQSQLKHMSVPFKNSNGTLFKYYIRNNPQQLKHIQNKTHQMCTEAVLKDGTLLQHVPDHLMTTELCMIAIKQNPYAIKFVKNQTKEMYMEIIRKNPQALFCDYQT